MNDKVVAHCFLGILIKRPCSPPPPDRLEKDIRAAQVGFIPGENDVSFIIPKLVCNSAMRKRNGADDLRMTFTSRPEVTVCASMR